MTKLTGSQMLFDLPSDRNDRFDTFEVDEHNEETVKLCIAFVSGSIDSSSLTLHGSNGSGKTHLLYAMGQEAKKNRQGTSLYISADDIVKKVHSAQTYEELKQELTKYENASFLLIDDLEKLYGLTEAQDQVFHLYNAVVSGGGKFAAAVADPPGKWNFADYLSTRLMWGQVTGVKPAGDEAWVRALIKTAADRGFMLSHDAAKWMITRLPRDPKALLSTLEKVDTLSLSTGRKASIQLVKEALEKEGE